MADSRYEQAKALHRDGRTAQARAVLLDLLAEQPGDLGARYALAICLIDLGETPDAQAQLRQVLADHPQHYEAAYQLGCLLQDEEQYEQAAAAFRQVLAVTDLRDTADRLRRCEAALGGSVPQPPSGPPPVRRLIESSHVASRGQLVMSLRLKARHILPLRSATAVVLILLAQGLSRPTFSVNRIIYIYTGYSTVTLLALVNWLLVGYLVLALLSLALRARMYTAEIYEYGMDVSSGILRRTRQFVWYYQITEPPTYLRRLSNYLTHTASLVVSYNNTASTTATVQLRGFGSPQRVDEVRSYLESRIPPERLPIRGPWT
ncbi:hypothetical protein GCM10010174_68810 [Kutzneria viridogrisea]|uniref:Uncharacterized protein n=2 Tax=Kutzneria TaxID=43356 RepID=W5WLV6_9PSEU|nr:tetratricopeptide repeat protein [Kutzneria albida]AHH99119.1 hypothetical protein KALB_5758 [Kutzneria albida DSM 43870]MBA8923326.1 hypothetical protein [Kutzneria viridogrisea]